MTATDMSRGPEGVVIDPETRTFTVNGVQMVIGTLERNPYQPPRRRDRSSMPATLVEYFERKRPTFFDELAPETPESVHASLLCGENGWWIEVAVWFDAGPYTAGMSGGFPDEPWDANEDLSADELLELWAKGCARTDPPPDEDEHPTRFGGGPPGDWRWYTDDEVAA